MTKQRLPAAPNTFDDSAMWLFLLVHTRTDAAFRFDSYLEADRIDADIMYRGATKKPGCAVIDFPEFRVSHVIMGRLRREQYRRLRWYALTQGACKHDWPEDNIE